MIRKELALMVCCVVGWKEGRHAGPAKAANPTCDFSRRVKRG